MGTTTNFGWPYPDETDLADVPSDMAALAAAIDADVDTLTTPPVISTYTPAVAGGGSATFSTLTGWSAAFGKWVFWNAYFVVNVAGSGSTAVTITSPSSPDRSTRQCVDASGESLFTAALVTGGQCMTLTGGSAAIWDRIRMSSGTATLPQANIQGSNLLAGGILVIQGMYRAA